MTASTIYAHEKSMSCAMRACYDKYTRQMRNAFGKYATGSIWLFRT